MIIQYIKSFTDNYIWVLINPTNLECYVIDPGNATKVIEYLNKHDLKLKGIFITHHHYDHYGGAQELSLKYDCPVYGPYLNENNNFNYQQVIENDAIDIWKENKLKILETPGHTLNHIIFWCKKPSILFSGDTLFSAGCGRLFEGTAKQMYKSLQKINQLPNETKVYCAHEYTLNNLQFAAVVDKDNLHIQQHINKIKKLNNIPSIPSTLGLENDINPFLRCHTKSIQSSVKTKFDLDIYCDEVEIFKWLRYWKDNFINET